MKYLLTAILLFIAINCFATNQKIIDGAKQYDIAVSNLHKILETIDTNSMSLDEFTEELHKTTDNSLSEEARDAAKNKIDKNHKILDKLNSQYAEAEAEVKKLDPFKKEYDRQKEIEFENKQFVITILAITIISLLLITFFGFAIWFAITRRKKYQHLLKEGKITQEQYDRMMSSTHEKSTLFNDDRTNPATGLRMTGGCDSGGNAYGSSSSSSSSSGTHR